MSRVRVWKGAKKQGERLTSWREVLLPSVTSSRANPQKSTLCYALSAKRSKQLEQRTDFSLNLGEFIHMQETHTFEKNIGTVNICVTPHL